MSDGRIERLADRLESIGGGARRAGVRRAATRCRRRGDAASGVRQTARTRRGVRSRRRSTPCAHSVLVRRPPSQGDSRLWIKPADATLARGVHRRRPVLCRHRQPLPAIANEDSHEPMSIASSHWRHNHGLADRTGRDRSQGYCSSGAGNAGRHRSSLIVVLLGAAGLAAVGEPRVAEGVGLSRRRALEPTTGRVAESATGDHDGSVDDSPPRPRPRRRATSTSTTTTTSTAASTSTTTTIPGVPPAANSETFSITVGGGTVTLSRRLARIAGGPPSSASAVSIRVAR